MAKGIQTRHSRSCRSRTGGRCDCTPSFQANVWEGATQTRHTYTAKTFSEADQWRNDALKAIRRDRPVDGRSRDSFKEVCEQTLELMRGHVLRNSSGDPYKPHTIRSYEQNLRVRVYPELGELPVSDVSRFDLQDLIDRLLGEGLSAGTVRTTITPVKVILGREFKRRRISENPTVGLTLPVDRSGRDRVAAPVEADRLLAVLPDHDRAIWATAMYAGLRRGELQALRVENVLLDEGVGVIRVVAGWDEKEGEIETKSRRRRRVPIVPLLREYLLAELLRTGRRAHPRARIFGTNELSPFQPQRLTERADRVWKVAGLNRITLHECRHTYASHMIAAGVNAKALSEYLGHANIAITIDTYGHLMPGNEAEAAELHEAYLRRSLGEGS